MKEVLFWSVLLREKSVCVFLVRVYLKDLPGDLHWVCGCGEYVNNAIARVDQHTDY